MLQHGQSRVSTTRSERPGQVGRIVASPSTRLRGSEDGLAEDEVDGDYYPFACSVLPRLAREVLVKRDKQPRIFRIRYRARDTRFRSGERGST